VSHIGIEGTRIIQMPPTISTDEMGVKLVIIQKNRLSNLSGDPWLPLASDALLTQKAKLLCFPMVCLKNTGHYGTIIT